MSFHRISFRLVSFPGEEFFHFLQGEHKCGGQSFWRWVGLGDLNTQSVDFYLPVFSKATCPSLHLCLVFLNPQPLWFNFSRECTFFLLLCWGREQPSGTSVGENCILTVPYVNFKLNHPILYTVSLPPGVYISLRLSGILCEELTYFLAFCSTCLGFSILQAV